MVQLCYRKHSRSRVLDRLKSYLRKLILRTRKTGTAHVKQKLRIARVTKCNLYILCLYTFVENQTKPNRRKNRHSDCSGNA